MALTGNGWFRLPEVQAGLLLFKFTTVSLRHFNRLKITSQGESGLIEKLSCLLLFVVKKTKDLPGAEGRRPEGRRPSAPK